MTGILYLCATPIGNLGDMTPRVVETLRSVDLIAAEDTRNSLKLMTHFEIHTPMTSYHEYNKVEKAYTLIAKLQEGQNIALITDAGTPAISDPGEVLVRMCLEAGIRVTSLPGAAACITALTMSGLSTRRFCFEGFLPQDKKERTEILEDYFETNDPRGAYVLVIEGKSYEEKKQEAQKNWLEMPVEEHVALYESQGFDRKEAMKKAAKDRGVSKRDIYQSLL